MQDNAQISVKEIIEQGESSKGRKRLKQWIGGTLVLIIIAALLVGWNLRGAANTMTYQTQPVQFGDLMITVTATGNLEATNQIEIGSELSGIITSMTADYNDIVKVNQPLVYLDDSKYKAAVMKSRAEVVSAEANYKKALATRNVNKKTLKRYQKTRQLTKGKLPSLEELEQVEADLERSTADAAAAAAAIEIAKASLQSNETDLKKTIIYSPVNGIVLSRNVEPGQTVAASLQAPVLYTLAEDLRYMELQVDVDEADVGLVKEGQSATFTVDAYPDRTFEAHITQVRYGAETTDGVVTYKTLLKVENPDLLLRPGMTATANITIQKIEKTLLVPNTALRFTLPKASEGKRESRGLLNSLMPRPPRSWMSKKKAGEEASGMNGTKPCVWILKNKSPVPVVIEKGATDGVLTAVTSQGLREGTEVIVSAINIGG